MPINIYAARIEKISDTKVRLPPLLTLFSGFALMLVLEASPVSARPPGGTTKSANFIPGGPATPRPSAAIAAQNSGNLSFSPLGRFNTRGRTSTSTSTQFTTDIR
jgi:hypothetical protein